MNITHLHVGTDHGGFALKEALVPWIADRWPDIEVIDHGAHELNLQDDYPDYGQMVASEVASSNDPADITEDITEDMAENEPESITESITGRHPAVIGLLLCRTGAGMAIVANRFAGVRAVVCRHTLDAEHARSHNNANILVLEGDYVSETQAKEIIETFLSTKFSGGRHVRRLLKIEKLFSK